MERHSDHRIKAIKINLNESVVICYIAGLKLFVLADPSVNVVELFYCLVCLPDG